MTFTHPVHPQPVCLVTSKPRPTFHSFSLESFALSAIIKATKSLFSFYTKSRSLNIEGYWVEIVSNEQNYICSISINSITKTRDNRFIVRGEFQLDREDCANLHAFKLLPASSFFNTEPTQLNERKITYQYKRLRRSKVFPAREGLGVLEFNDYGTMKPESYSAEFAGTDSASAFTATAVRVLPSDALHSAILKRNFDGTLREFVKQKFNLNIIINH